MGYLVRIAMETVCPQAVIACHGRG
jgi:hypothetical protein